jgi:hypothetical protein
MLTATLYRFGHPNTRLSLMRFMFFILMLFIGVVAITFALATSAKAQVPAGYKIRAVISACTLQGCQSQTWFLKTSRWCGKTEEGWSPTQSTGKLSVTCRRPL